MYLEQQFIDISINRKKLNMSYTLAIKQIKQPRGGYISSKLFSPNEYDIVESLIEIENPRHSSDLATTIENLSYWLSGINIFKIWRNIPLNYKSLNSLSILIHSSDINSEVIRAAHNLSVLDLDYELTDNEITYIKNLTNRTIEFLCSINPISFAKPFFSWETVNNRAKNSHSITAEGEIDFMTEDTIWDIKVYKSSPLNAQNKLQVITYYLAGLHSDQSHLFKRIKYLGIYNPKSNISYKLPISSITNSIVEEIEKNLKKIYIIPKNNDLKIFVTDYEEELSASINNRINELKKLIEYFEGKKTTHSQDYIKELNYLMNFSNLIKEYFVKRNHR